MRAMELTRVPVPAPALMNVMATQEKELGVKVGERWCCWTDLGWGNLVMMEEMKQGRWQAQEPPLEVAATWCWKAALWWVQRQGLGL